MSSLLSACGSTWKYQTDQDAGEFDTESGGAKEKAAHKDDRRIWIFFNDIFVGNLGDLQDLAEAQRLPYLLRQHCRLNSCTALAPKVFDEIISYPGQQRGQILMYVLPGCSYCASARKLFARKGVRCSVVDLTVHPERAADMKGTTVPEIYFNEKHMGGFDDMKHLDRLGKLDNLIDVCLATPTSVDAPRSDSFHGEMKSRERPSLIGVANSNTFESESWVSLIGRIMEELISAGADLENLTDNMGNPAFTETAAVTWFKDKYTQLSESSELISGQDNELWSDVRTQLSVAHMWKDKTRTVAIIDAFIWAVHIVLLVLAVINAFAMDDEAGYRAQLGIATRINGKPYDFTEQPNKRYADTDNRQDVWNFMGADGLLGNVFDLNGFYTRPENKTGDAVHLPDNIATHGQYKFTVRGLRLLGNVRLRQLRVPCTRAAACHVCPFVPDSHQDVRDGVSSLDRQCMGNFDRNTPSGQSKDRIVGVSTKTAYKWSDEGKVPGFYAAASSSIWYPEAGSTIVVFPNNRTEALTLLSQLEADEFIDLCTRLVVIEFTVVNDAEALILTYRAAIETTSAGFFEPSSEISVSRHRTSASDFAFEVILLLHFLALVVAEMFECTRGWPDADVVSTVSSTGNAIHWYKPKHVKAKPYAFAFREAGYYGPGYYRLSELREIEDGIIFGDDMIIDKMEFADGKQVTKGSRINMNSDKNKNISGYTNAAVSAATDPIQNKCWGQRRWPRYLLYSWFNAQDLMHSLVLLCFASTIVAKVAVIVDEHSLRDEVSAAINAASTAGVGLSEHQWFPATSFHLAQSAKRLRIAVGILLFLSCIELLFKLSFLHGVAVFLRIIERMILKLRSFTLVLFSLLLAFGLMGWVFFGNHVAVYNTIPMAMLELVGGASINGLPAWSATHTVDRTMAAVFHLLFVVFFFFLMTNLLISVMTEGYEAVRERSNRVWAFVQFNQLKDQMATGAPRRSILQVVYCCCRIHRVHDQYMGKKQPQDKSEAIFMEFAAELKMLEAGIEDKNRYKLKSRIGKSLVMWLEEVRRRRWQGRLADSK